MSATVQVPRRPGPRPGRRPPARERTARPEFERSWQSFCRYPSKGESTATRMAARAATRLRLLHCVERDASGRSLEPAECEWITIAKRTLSTPGDGFVAGGVMNGSKVPA